MFCSGSEEMTTFEEGDSDCCIQCCWEASQDWELTLRFSKMEPFVTLIGMVLGLLQGWKHGANKNR